MGNNPQQTTRTHSDPQRAKTTHNDLTRWKKIHYDPKQRKAINKDPTMVKGKVVLCCFSSSFYCYGAYTRIIPYFSSKHKTFVITHCVKSVQIRSYFWSVFSCIQSEYREIQTINNSMFGHFLRGDLTSESARKNLLKPTKILTSRIFENLA